MKTLSDDITIKLPTTGMDEGYVVTTIYANGIGVFTGRSYIPGDDSSLYVNVNDIAAQNHGKNDYLKLNNGSVESMTLVDDVFGTYNYLRRWNRGLIGEYKVHVTDGSNAFNSSEIVLAGYDYINKNLKPLFIDYPRYPNDTSLGRIMQGCDWRYIPEDEIGEFSNLLLPHYPHKYTAKYGFGLQVYAGEPPVVQPNQAYSLRRDIGSSATKELPLGSPIYGYSNTTFVSLFTLISRISNSANSDYDVSVYLKKTETSGDEFGDWEEGYDRYKAQLFLERMNYKAYQNGEKKIDMDYSVPSRNGLTLVERYMANVPNNWNYDKLASGDKMIYDTGWRRSTAIVESEVELYMHTDAGASYILPLSGPEEMMGIDLVMITPVVSREDSSDYIPDRYIGTCPVAILDGCYARYYLAWNDRYGDIQSQAFEGKIEFSESFERSEVIDYKMRRRVIHNEVQPKWKLNTKWLPEDIYPMYESIFTSPYLLLYDTETDRSWNVIVTNSEYKEKTFNTEKTLFNLELTVEANKTQNNIY